MESDGKAWVFCSLAYLCYLSCREGALRGIPHVCINPGFDFSKKQTTCRQLQRWEQGWRDALEPSSALLSWRGPLERPRVLTESSACTHPSGLTYTRSRSWKCARSWEICGHLGQTQHGPPVGSHSRPVCPVRPSPCRAMHQD